MTNFPFSNQDCSCNEILETPPCCNNCGRCQCTGAPCLMTPGIREITQKRIQNQVRVPQSQFISVLSSVTISGGKTNLPINNPNLGFFGVNQNQSSDRNRLHIQTRFVPSRGNSTKSSLTRHRPGSMGPAGKNAIGVDEKHNSYARYLGRIKSRNLQSNWNKKDNPNIAFTGDINPFGISDEEQRYFKRFSRINYSLLGGGLCRFC